MSKFQQLRAQLQVNFQRARRAPWYIKVLVLLATVYLLSPIDLIPDFIPVIGHLDDVILVGAMVKLLAKYAADTEGTGLHSEDGPANLES